MAKSDIQMRLELKQSKNYVRQCWSQAKAPTQPFPDPHSHLSLPHPLKIPQPERLRQKPKSSTHKGGLIGINLKEKNLHVCLSTLSQCSHPHLAPLRQYHILHFAAIKLGNTLCPWPKPLVSARKRGMIPNFFNTCHLSFQSHHQSTTPSYVTLSEDK